VLILSEAEASPEHKGYLCAQLGAFNLHAARRVAGNDKQGKEFLCRYILRPPLANERLHLLALEALISRMAALVPPPKRHVTVYSSVFASNSKWRRLIIPKTEVMTANGAEARCPDCGGKLKLIALVKTEETIQSILSAMHLPTGPPKVVKPRPPETSATHEEGIEWDVGGEGENADWPEYPD
jgi:hypothetical protein